MKPPTDVQPSIDHDPGAALLPFLSHPWGAQCSDILFEEGERPRFRLNLRFRAAEDLGPVDLAAFGRILADCLALDDEYPLPDALVAKIRTSASCLTTGVGCPLTEAELSMIAEKRDMAFSITIDGEAHRVRAHLAKHYGRLTLDLRLLPERVRSLEELGFDHRLEGLLSDWECGLVLVCGPMGSGKSTTAAALIRHFSSQRPGARILTLEEPVEYVLPDHVPHGVIHQKHVGVRGDIASWEEGIQSSRREVLSLMLLGEMRHADVVRLALDSAGALPVISTLHATTIRGVLLRLAMALGGPLEAARTMLAGNLRGIVLQDLVPGPEDAEGRGRPSLVYSVLSVTDPATREWIAQGEWRDLEGLKDDYLGWDASLSKIATGQVREGLRRRYAQREW